jgi:transcriptional antiterminator NusG
MNQDAAKGKWFVVHTLSGHENRVRETMERQLKFEREGFPVYEVFIPTEKVAEVRNGKKITTTRKYFPGYVLVRADLYLPDGKVDDTVWYFIKQTQGVIGLVGGETPMPLSEKEINDLMRQSLAHDETAKPKIDYKTGETVRIKDGAFENFEGTIEEIDSERGKLKLMVAIFGRLTPVELEFWQVGRE